MANSFDNSERTFGWIWSGPGDLLEFRDLSFSAMSFSHIVTLSISRFVTGVKLGIFKVFSLVKTEIKKVV